MQVPRYFTFCRGPMVQRLCTKVVGFIMHHLADAIPSEASTLWFLVINDFVQSACSLAVRMAMSVGLGLPTEHELVVGVGAVVRSNLRIADGLNPISWSRVFENFEHGCPMGRNCVPERAETKQESDEEVKMVGGTPKDTMYCTPKHATPPRKKGGHVHRI